MTIRYSKYLADTHIISRKKKKTIQKLDIIKKGKRKENIPYIYKDNKKTSREHNKKRYRNQIKNDHKKDIETRDNKKQ